MRANQIPLGAVRGEGFLQKTGKFMWGIHSWESQGLAPACRQIAGRTRERERKTFITEGERPGWAVGYGWILARGRKSNVKSLSCFRNSNLPTHLFESGWDFNTTPSVILLRGETPCGVHLLSLCQLSCDWYFWIATQRKVLTCYIQFLLVDSCVTSTQRLDFSGPCSIV